MVDRIRFFPFFILRRNTVSPTFSAVSIPCALNYVISWIVWWDGSKTHWACFFECALTIVRKVTGKSGYIYVMKSAHFWKLIHIISGCFSHDNWITELLFLANFFSHLHRLGSSTQGKRSCFKCVWRPLSHLKLKWNCGCVEWKVES